MATETEFDAILSSLAVVESAREKLHARLQAAHFELSTAQRLEEQRGHLLSFEALPTASGSLAPLITIRGMRGTGNDADDKEEEEDMYMELASVGPSSRSETTTIKKPKDGEDEKPSGSRHEGSSSSGGDEEAAEFPVGEDPVYYISAAPSRELRAVQNAFQDVVRLAVAVAAAQRTLLAQADAVLARKEQAP